MIEFLRNKGSKAYNEISEIATTPNLLFSNDRGQCQAEANYNLYTIQKINKLIKKSNVSIAELEQTFSFVEVSWTAYLRKHFRDKAFVFYIWGDYQIPAVRLSVVSYYEGMELPFGCILKKVNLMDLFREYIEKAQFDGIPISEGSECGGEDVDEKASSYVLNVYSNIIKC
ncbi:hypothetical protein [Paenibacillus eucommiae]|nr:hypothetical protein [Paenibacillus eucommiae]